MDTLDDDRKTDIEETKLRGSSSIIVRTIRSQCMTFSKADEDDEHTCGDEWGVVRPTPSGYHTTDDLRDNKQ